MRGWMVSRKGAKKDGKTQRHCFHGAFASLFAPSRETGLVLC